ncbi:hypothetical protein FGF1_33200 [Flavobacteriaceae bacterium GF1]
MVVIKFVIAFIFSVGLLNNQDNVDQVDINVKVGDVFEIGRPETNKYRNIDFPKANLTIKHGGMANYKRQEGEKVVVISVKERNHGSIEVKIIRTDGGTFFKSHGTVVAGCDNALNRSATDIMTIFNDWLLRSTRNHEILVCSNKGCGRVDFPLNTRLRKLFFGNS